MSFRASVSIVLAVYNGELFIRKKLECLLALKYPRDLVKILVVSDGSTDGTDDIVESFAGQGVRLLRAPHGGKVAAMNLALRHATGELLFCTDVRQTLNPEALAHLVANFADPTVGAVTGELWLLNSDRAGDQADMEMYWRYERWARLRHSQIDSTYTVTGCIYAVRRSLVEPIRPDTLTDDAVIPLNVFFRGYRVIVDPEAMAFDYPTAAGVEFRRKLRTLAGLWQVHARMRPFFTRANRMRFHFFSHKSTRLALPWAILLVWVATIMLPASSFRSFLLLDELAFVLLAAIDQLVPRSFPLKRVSSPARTFLAMNAAALLSVVVFIVPAGVLWPPTEVEQANLKTGPKYIKP
jgi:cellulose synthase/poly-beta-1,6-N-acetylglucosamine synthase-like glycosyltransferase